MFCVRAPPPQNFRICGMSYGTHRATYHKNNRHFFGDKDEKIYFSFSTRRCSVTPSKQAEIAGKINDFSAKSDKIGETICHAESRVAQTRRGILRQFFAIEGKP